MSARNHFFAGFFWRFAERCGAQGITFIVTIVLARLLDPSTYGTIALVNVFIAILGVFIDSGFGNALIQKKDADDTDFSTVFFFNIAMCSVIYLIMFIAAPFIAEFYNDLSLTPVIRVTSLILLISGVKNVQQAYVSRNMLFKRFFFATLGGTVGAAVLGIGMAYAGFGVWALVAQMLFNTVVDTIILWVTVKWRPRLLFSFKRLKGLFSYGWKLLCSSLIDSIYNNIYSLIVGKFYSASDLGYYNKGKSFVTIIVQNINATINSVLFPVLSASQDEKSRVKSMVRRSIVTSTFIIFPAMAGLAAISKSLILILLTEKWLPAVIFLQFCCFTYAFWPVHTANLQAIKAVGRSDIFLKLEIIKKCIGIAILVITLPMGLVEMMIGRCVSTILSSIINAFPNRKLLDYSYIEQLKDMLPSFILAIVMFLAVLAIQLFELNIWLTLGIQIAVGVVLYFGLAKLFKFECLEYILATVKSFRKKK